MNVKSLLQLAEGAEKHLRHMHLFSVNVLVSEVFCYFLFFS